MSRLFSVTLHSTNSSSADHNKEDQHQSSENQEDRAIDTLWCGRYSHESRGEGPKEGISGGKRWRAAAKDCNSGAASHLNLQPYTATEFTAIELI